MKIDCVDLCEPFLSLFPKRPEVISNLAAAMKEQGFADPAFPVVLWGNKLIDGYHRVEAAKQAGLERIPDVSKGFLSEDEAVLYCIRANAWRRHLTDGEIIHLAPELDERNKRIAEARAKAGTPVQESDRGITTSRSAKQTAQDLGISESKVDDLRFIRAHGKPEDIKQIEEGKKSIHAKAEEIRKKRTSKPKKPKPQPKDPNKRTHAPEFDDQHEFGEAYNKIYAVLIRAKMGHWESLDRVITRNQLRGLINLTDERGECEGDKTNASDGHRI